MGGHGGLNILPSKSWNVYSAKNRARVARDEEQAALEAANAHVAELAEQARQNLQALRARAGGEKSGDADQALAPPPMEHVNFFSDLEAAERALERDSAQKKAEQKLVSKLMPDLDLAKSTREPAPWYTQAAPALLPSEEAQVAAALSGGVAAVDGKRQAAEAFAALHEGDDRKRRQKSLETGDAEAQEEHSHLERKHRHHHHKHRRHSRHHRDDRDARESTHGKRRRESTSPEAAAAATRDRSDLVMQLRQERLARERQEQKRTGQVLAPMPSTSASGRPSSGYMHSRYLGGEATGWPREDSPRLAAVDGGLEASDAKLHARFLELTGQVVKLKPQSARSSRRASHPS